MYPAPPVTRTLSFISALQAEEALQRLEQAVPPPGLRGLFEGDGRLVQELVEQRMAEVLDFSAVVRAQMREAAQRALQLGGAHLVQPLAELLQDGHDDQSAVPDPKALDFLAHNALRRRNVAAPLGRRLCGHRLKIVDVVQEDVLELGDRGLHIARHAEIEDTQRTPAASSDGRRDAGVRCVSSISACRAMWSPRSPSSRTSSCTTSTISRRWRHRRRPSGAATFRRRSTSWARKSSAFGPGTADWSSGPS